MQFLSSNRFTGLTDQALFSLATLSQTFVYAKVFAPREFAIFGLTQGACLVAQGVQRAACVLPMITTSTADGGDPKWLWLDGYLRVLTSGLLLAVWVASPFLGLSEVFRSAMGLAAFCTIATLAFEMQRRWAFLTHDRKRVIAATLAYFILTIFSVILVAKFAPNAVAAATGLFVSAGIASLVGRIRRPVPADSNIRLQDHLSVVAWNLMSFFPYMLYNNGMVIVIGLLSDTRAVALFTASKLFTAPIQVLVQAVDSTDKPRARRMYLSNGVTGLRNSLDTTRKSLLLAGVPYIALMAVIASPLSEFLFGSSYPDMAAAIRLWVLVGLAMLLGQPIETGLLVLHKSSLIFLTRGAAAAATILALALLPTQLSNVIPILAAAAGWTAAGLLAWIMLKSLLRAALPPPSEAR